MIIVRITGQIMVMVVTAIRITGQVLVVVVIAVRITRCLWVGVFVIQERSRLVSQSEGRL